MAGPGGQGQSAVHKKGKPIRAPRRAQRTGRVPRLGPKEITPDWASWISHSRRARGGANTARLPREGRAGAVARAAAPPPRSRRLPTQGGTCKECAPLRVRDETPRGARRTFERASRYLRRLLLATNNSQRTIGHGLGRAHRARGRHATTLTLLPDAACARAAAVAEAWPPRACLIRRVLHSKAHCAEERNRRARAALPCLFGAAGRGAMGCAAARGGLGNPEQNGSTRVAAVSLRAPAAGG